MPLFRQLLRLCSTKPKKDRNTIATVKRQNWENLNLFGPLIKTVKPRSGTLIQRKTNLDDRKTDSNKLTENADISSILTFPLENVWRPLDSSLEYPNAVLELNANAKINNNYPSVSAILSKTMSPESQKALENWKNLMIEKLGEDGFNMHQKQVLEQGKSLHESVAQVLKGAPYDSIKVHPSNWGHWKSLESVFPRIRNAAVLENWVMHPFLNYRGIIDCVAMYRKEVVLIEWKTSSKLKSKIEYTYDNPIQVAAYIGALNYDPNYKFQLNKGVLVIAYESGSPAHTFVMSKEMCVEYWKKWLKRLQLFNTLSTAETNDNNARQMTNSTHVD